MIDSNASAFFIADPEVILRVCISRFSISFKSFDLLVNDLNSISNQIPTLYRFLTRLLVFDIFFTDDKIVFSAEFSAIASRNLANTLQKKAEEEKILDAIFDTQSMKRAAISERRPQKKGPTTATSAVETTSATTSAPAATTIEETPAPKATKRKAAQPLPPLPPQLPPPLPLPPPAQPAQQQPLLPAKRKRH